MLHRAVTGRKDGEKKSAAFYFALVLIIMRRTRGKRSVDYNLALPAFGWFLLFSIRLISCASTPYDASPEISPLCRYFWSSLPTLLLINDTYACVPDSLLWFFSFLLLFWSRCRSGLLCHECSVYSNLPVYSSACFLRFLMIWLVAYCQIICVHSLHSDQCRL